MRLSSASFLFLSFGLDVAVAAPSSGHPYSPPGNGWGLKKFKSLVTFGDSYTDENRLSYFGSHNGQAPPAGWYEPASNMTASGGKTWPRFVADETGAHLYDYAVSGAVCSNNITPRIWSTINAPFPDIANYELPAFLADKAYIYPSNHTHFMSVPPDETVYAMWIGTNDLGDYAFLTDSQIQGKTIPDYVDCVYNQIDRLYKSGARYFVLMNVAPLQLAPLYATPENGGVGANHYWPDKPANLTEISYRMWEQVVQTNQAYEYRTPYEASIKKSWPGAKIANMDMYGLISHLYYNADQYFQAPADPKGFNNHCTVDGSTCTQSKNPNRFLWYDELHPSQRTDEIIAKNFIDVVNGHGEWATYW